MKSINKMTRLYIIFLVSFNCVYMSFCANILIADNMPSPSHQIWNYGIAEGLLDRGHNVTMLGQPPPKPIQHPNFHHLSLQGLFSTAMKDFNSQALINMSTLDIFLFYHDYTLTACSHAFQSDGFKALMNYPKDFKFDIILFDLTIADCFLPLIQRFGYPPTVGMTAFLIPSYIAYDFGNELNLGFIPSFYTPFSSEMTFLQRLESYFWTYAHILVRDTYVQRNIYPMMVDAFGKNMDPLTDLKKHVSLLLVNWNPVLNFPQGMPPNIIPVGGSHIRPKKLPKDIQEIMDNAPNGVILFSLGSNVRSDDFSEEQRKIIKTTFSKLKETVLWKFETNITGLPKNVIARKWLPQLEILAHPKLKLFISHSGGLSTVEATYFGVPVLGMPFFIDQNLNIDNLVRKGVARKIECSQLTETNFLENINEMLNNNKYTKNMKDLSRRVRDQPQAPLDRAVFWIEYAIRHNGTHFLNPQSRYLPLYITSSTDIHLFCICVISLSLFILITACKTVKNVFKNLTRGKPKFE